MHKKLLPSLGGIKKNYIRKAHCLKKVLQFLANQFENAINSLKIKESEKIVFDKIKNDLVSLSRYENENKVHFILNVRLF